MCLMLYIGADRELPTTKAWDQNNPAFYVSVIQEQNQIPAITNHLQTEYMYYVGSHQGCGCGFGYESTQEYEESISADDIPEDVRAAVKEDRADRIACMSDLREYLAKVTLDGPVKLLVTWADEEDKDIEHVARVNPSFFGGDQCYLADNSLFEVRQPSL